MGESPLRVCVVGLDEITADRGSQIIGNLAAGCCPRRAQGNYCGDMASQCVHLADELDFMRAAPIGSHGRGRRYLAQKGLNR